MVECFGKLEGKSNLKETLFGEPLVGALYSNPLADVSSFFRVKPQCHEFDLMNPNTIAAATTIRSTIPTIAMNGFIGYNAHMMIPPMTTKIMEITRPNTASIIPLKVHTS